jgi:peroxiredoxin
MRKLISLLAAAIFLYSCSSEPQYVIKGKIAGSDSTEFFLLKRTAGKTDTINSAILKKGSFTMKGPAVEYPQMVLLSAKDPRQRIQFYLENAEITIEGTLDSLYNAEVTGSKTQDEYKSLIAKNKVFSDRYSEIVKQFQEANQKGDPARAAELRKQMESVEAEMMEMQKEFVKNNPASYLTPSLLSGLAYDMDPAEIEEAIANLDTALAKHPQIVAMAQRAQAMKVVSIGQKAPDFTMNDVEGNPVSLSSKLGPKLLLLDFWAAWCGPCRQENPNIVKVYQEFNKKGFDVFGVSLDQTKDAWVKAIADDNLTWTHVSDLQYWSNAAAKVYAVNSIPASFLLDETGTIIARNLRGDALYDKVKEVLGGTK